MADIGALLKHEIVRLARRETRAQLQPVQKASAQHRRHIAELKRQVAALQRLDSLVQRRLPDRPATVSAGSADAKVRFVAKGLKSHRDRIGLSAAEYGRLVGASAQSVYNWERGRAVPRPPLLGAIAGLRGIGKREAQRRLEQLSAARKARKR